MIIIISGAFFLNKNREPDEGVNAVPGPLAHQIYDAIRELTTTQLSDYGHAISLLVPGASIVENTWDFRGNARSAERDKPFFGSVENTCLEYGDITCWRLSSLTLDGSALPLVEVASSEDASENGDKKPPEQLTSLQPEIQKQVADIKPEPQIWRTRTNNVNGRTGPGTNFGIAFKIPSSVDLGFLEERDGWGLFKYDAEGGKEGKIWISMRLVQPR